MLKIPIYTTAIMEAPKSDPPKLPDMVMCGDHPSFTKAELSLLDTTADDKEKEKPKDKNVPSYAKISPTSSRTEGPAPPPADGRHAAPASRRADPASARPFVQAAFPWAALGSFRWPPYLLAVWVLVLVLTHALHCLVGVLERALPALRKCIDYFRKWTEDSWKMQTDINQKVFPITLGAFTALLYVVYFGLYAMYGVVVWSVEPLSTDADDGRSAADLEAKIIDYLDEATT